MKDHTILPHCNVRRSHRKHESGQGFAEYALLLALTSVVLIAGLSAFGPAIGDHYNRVIDAFGINTTADEEEETPTEEPGGGEEEETPTPEPTAQIDVYVVDDSSVGMPGVLVAVYQDGSAYKGITGTTDGSGMASFVLNHGTYSFVATYDGDDYPAAGSYTLPDTNLAIIQINPPESTIDFTVRVEDSLSQPISGITVTLHDTGGAYQNVSAVTNSGGNAVLSVPGGDFKFKAVVDETNYWSAEVDTQVTTSTTISVPIADYTIAIKRNGKNFNGATVTALLPNGDSTGISGVTSKGEVTLTLSPGTYKFDITKVRNNGKILNWTTGGFAFPGSDPLTINLY